MNTVRKLWENSNITNRYPGLSSRVLFDEPMSSRTTFRVGGPADILVAPANEGELVAIVETFAALSVPVSILGGGSNLLVSDRGIRGIVISLEAFDSIARIPPEPALRDTDPARASATDTAPPGSVPPDNPSSVRLSAEAAQPIVVRAGAGASMKALTEWCAASSLSGLESFAGLPGSVGGAVFMNARCYDRSVSDAFSAAEILRFQGGRCALEKTGYTPDAWAYKRSPFQERLAADALLLTDGAAVILSASFTLHPGEPGAIREAMDRYIRDREEKGHFRFPSAGSMFKNNHAFGKPSGKIIDEAGLRGFRLGDAEVAAWHGNIVINAGNARAEDLRTLVIHVQKQVYEKTGFMLEPEVIFAGEW